MSDREWDVVLYGATGFTGKQAASYFSKHAPEGLKWAIAGRDAAKLDAVREGLGRSDLGVIVADALDGAAIESMVARTRVVLSTAGPFALYGDKLVETCVAYGVHYVDITGETPWVRTLIDRFHDRAARDKTRIVPLCGFDSIPSDLGAFMVADFVRREWDLETASVRSAFTMSRGGLNGGTLASALNISNSRQGRALYDVALLNPGGSSKAERDRGRLVTGVSYDSDFDKFLCPFLMASVNTQVVRRSNALLGLEGRAYGSDFRYSEAMEARSRARAWALTGGLAFAGAMLGNPVGRRVAKWLGPQPGEGPSEEAMDNGYTRTRYIGVAADGRKVRGEMVYHGDAGNRMTVLALCECALTLATQLDELPDRGGILTPATAFEGVILTRLREAGMAWQVGPWT